MDEATERRRSGPGLIVAVALPLVVLGLAYVLWRISDRLLWIGPFDRAAFGWSFVIPLWLAAPVVTGFVWRRMPDRVVALAAVTITFVLAAVSAWLFWKAVAFPACGNGPRFSAADMIVPAGLVGLVLGGGIAGAGLVTRLGLRRYAWPRAVAMGVGATVVAFAVTFFVAVAAFGDQGCQRPPIV
jgi:hypothetical protein